MKFLYEDLTFDQLFRYSEPKRVKRSDTVRGPPLEINANSDTVYHSFNFKSFPSTTGLRHHGFIKFKKPKVGNPRKPLQHIPCEVDCTCPDYRYRFAWVNKQKGAGRVGASSMNQAHNRAPRITNPAGIPGLCKHILATRDYIYGLLAKFPGGEPDTGDKLAQLVKYADKRWANFDELMAKAKDQEKWYAAVKQALNTGHAWNDYDHIMQLYRAKGGQFIGIPKGVPMPNAPAATVPGPPPPPEELPPLPQRQQGPGPRGPMLPKAGKPTVQAKLAVPPGERGRGLPIGKPGAAQPPKPVTTPRRPPRRESVETFEGARVDILNGPSGGPKTIESMTALKEALKQIEEIEDAEVASPSEIAADMGGEGEGGPEMPPPSEPPMSDTAVGADTEGNVVLQLLSDIKDLIAQLVGAEDAEIEGDMPPIPGEGEEEDIAVDAIPEVPEDEDENEEENEFLPGKSAGPEQ